MIYKLDIFICIDLIFVILLFLYRLNSNPDTLSNMTTPKQFKANVLKFLKRVDKRLPKNSHIVLIGLVNGSRIYPDMAERYHPLGKFLKK